VVQDDEVTRDALVGMLERFGAAVHTAADGGEAVHFASAQEFDLVLMDIHLPVLDGYAATRSIRKNPRHARAPIVGITASQSDGIRERALAAGMNDCLTAPLGRDELAAALGIWVQSVSDSLPPGPVSTDSPVPPTAPLLDEASGIRRIGGSKPAYHQLLTRFVATHAHTAGAVLDAVNRRDEDGASLLHGLVSAAGNVGAIRLHELARELETRLKGGEGATARRSLDDLDTVSRATFDAARSYLVCSPAPDPVVPQTDADASGLAEQMVELLDQHDTRALDLVDALCIALREHASPEALRLLTKLVRGYEFERARAKLATILDGYRSR
jgi:CheY-like chemotaxis protein/HPt (histidine-containing phosphotransfer) domain-containing protein